MKGRALSTEKGKTELVDLHDVWVQFERKWVLKSIYLKCYEGEILGIVGPNGSGKSTLIKVILGLIPTDKGNVKLFGRDPDNQSRQEIGYLPQISHPNGSFHPFQENAPARN